MKNSFIGIIISIVAAFTRPSFATETLTMDVWDPYAPTWAVEEFKSVIKRKYQKDINVVVKYVFSPEEFFYRVRANETDIISPSHNLIRDHRFDFLEKKLVLPLDRKIITNISGVEERFINNSFANEGDVLYGVPFASGAYSLLYRKSQFKSPPKSWSVLWDPKYKGRYSISKDFYESNIYIAALAAGVAPENMAEVKFLESTQVKNKLETLLKNANYWHGVPRDQDVEKSVLTTAWGFSHSVHNDENKEWGFAYPKEGVTIWTDYLMVTRAVNRSEFARVLAMEWLNFVLSPDIQRRLTIETLRCYSAVPAAYESLTKKEFKIDPKEKEFLFKKAIYWPVLSARNRNGMKFIYDKTEKRIETKKANETKPTPSAPTAVER